MLECTVCWKQAKGYELSKSDVALRALQEGFSAAVEGWKARQAQWEAEKQQHRLVIDTERRAWEAERLELQRKVKLWADRYRAAKVNRGTGSVFIPPDQLKNLIRLCHPDRHKNSEESNAVTKWLLAQREK